MLIPFIALFAYAHMLPKYRQPFCKSSQIVFDSICDPYIMSYIQMAGDFILLHTIRLTGGLTSHTHTSSAHTIIYPKQTSPNKYTKINK